MEVFYGKGVSDGCCIGRAAILRAPLLQISSHTVSDGEAEWLRYLAARAACIRALEEQEQAARRRVGEEHANIFAIHAMMAQDEDFNDAIEHAIKEQHQNAAHAISVTAAQFSEMFSHMESEYMRERATDVRDVAQRILRCLQGEEEDARAALPDEPYILCADDLTPGETARLDPALVLGFATARGTLTSHTAILARAMGLPALVGLGEDAIAALRDDDTLAIDEAQGALIRNPDPATVTALQQKTTEQQAQKTRLLAFRDRPTRSADGIPVHLFANVGTLNELDDVLACGAEGIGLLRSEFLYLGRTEPPDEQEQLSLYRSALSRMGNRPVIIRTLDTGADKRLPYLPDTGHEENPALGCRAVRYSLTHPELFLTQARALLRAAPYGNLSVMFPLITATEELQHLLALWQQARTQVCAQTGAPAADVPLGIMIETPAAALISDTLAPMVDFFSIGTNDLTQYTLAMDRQNGALLPFFQPHHPAVLSLIRTTVENAKRAGIWVGICGELGADLSVTEQLLQLGVDELSVSPGALLALREHISHITLSNSTKKESTHAEKNLRHS